MAVTPVALKDAIPLLETGGTVGRNNAKDIRLGWINSLCLPTASEHAVRQGVLPRRWDGGGAFRSFRIYASGTPDRNITFAGGMAVITRTSEGAYLVYETADTAVLCDLADATNPVVEAAVIRLYDKNLSADTGAPLHGPHYDVIRGVPGAVINLNGTPGTAGAPPVIPDGVLLLAYITRLAGVAGDTIGSAGNPVTDKRKSAGLLGGVRTLLPGDLATDVGFLPGELRNQLVGGNITPPEYWGTDTKWHGTTVTTVTQPTQVASGSLAAASTAKVATMTIPWPGYPYKVKPWGALLVGAGVSGNEVVMQINLDNDAFLAVGGGNAPNAASLCWSSLNIPASGQEEGVLAPGISAAITDGATHSLYFWMKNNTGASSVTVFAGYSYRFLAEIIPV